MLLPELKKNINQWDFNNSANNNGDIYNNSPIIDHFFQSKIQKED
jgi:hypothetical protein